MRSTHFQAAQEELIASSPARLRFIKDAFPKMLIARTYQPEYQHEGIRIADATDWLSDPIPQKE